jgi:hypothetical protein
MRGIGMQSLADTPGTGSFFFAYYYHYVATCRTRQVFLQIFSVNLCLGELAVLQ